MTAVTTSWREYLNPRHELVMLASAGMETCWAYGFFAVALQAGGHGQRGVSVLTYAALLLCAIYSSRFVLNTALPQQRKQATIVVIAVIAILLSIRATLFSDFALFDLSWLGQLPSALVNLFITMSPVALVTMLGVYAWWRGLSLAQASYDFDGVGFRFRLGVLMLALLALVNTWVGRVDISGLLIAFFFFGLLAVALARQEDVGRAESSVSLPLKGPWLAILAGSVLLVLGLAALLALLFTPQGIRAFFDLLRPLEPLVIAVLYAVLIVVSIIVEFVFNVLSYLISTFVHINPNSQPIQLPQRPPPDFLQQQNDFAALAAYWDPLRMACAVVLFAGILLMLALSLGEMQKRNRKLGNATREGVPITVDLNPFRRLRDLFHRPSFALDDSDIASIRRIYANLARMAAERGHPRREAETPYEYMRGLREALPESVDEERAITDAYVRVHYGEQSPSPTEVAKVREAWKNIKERGAKPNT